MTLAVPSGTALHRGWLHDRIVIELGRLAVPSGTALHRGQIRAEDTPNFTARRPFGDGPSSRHQGHVCHHARDCSPSLRGRPFIEASSPSRQPDCSAARRPFGDGPSSRQMTRTTGATVRGTRRPFGDGPSSRQQRSVRRADGGYPRRPFGDGPSSRPGDALTGEPDGLAARRPFGDGPSSRRPSHRRPLGIAPSRRPFGDGPSSRLEQEVGVKALAVFSPSLRGRPFIEAPVLISTSTQMATRRPFGDGPSSRPVHDGRLRRRARPRRPFGDGPSSRRRRRVERRGAGVLAVPSGTALHRGALVSTRREVREALAVPSGTALHRGEGHGRPRPFVMRVSPSLRGRPFIEATCAASTGGSASARRPFGDGPSSRQAQPGHR